ncbi:hypothetical protein R3P38DRAFT_2939110 [Favolaschia claudopus]|uniref:Uncharacterized protein n=1 Tax=Favolaschia claudopus TaxID=2862362 RepID=A0AAW0BM48_9AGAR
MQWWRKVLASFIPPFLQKLHPTRSTPLSSRHSESMETTSLADDTSSAERFADSAVQLELQQTRINNTINVGERGAAGTNGLLGGDGGPGEAPKIDMDQQRNNPVGDVSGEESSTQRSSRIVYN